MSESESKWGKLEEAFDHEAKEAIDQEIFDEALKNANAEQIKASGILDNPEYKALQEELTLLKKRNEELLGTALREKAEKENTVRRMNEELRKTREYSLTEFAREMLAANDSLEQALLVCEGQPAIKEGLELTLQQIHSVFEKFGVKSFSPQGEKFDPNCQEAMSIVEDPNTESGKVLVVFQKGYWISDRLLRPARVVVAK